MVVRIIQGDCRDVLRTLADESVQCVVTSPPYWGLRDYGTAKWEGGDPTCSHRVGGQVADSKAPGAITSGVRPGVDASRCKLCGALRVDSQIGLESSPDAFITEMVDVFREVRRVLRKDGTLWLNLGDCYVTSPPGNKNPPKDVDGAYTRKQGRQLGRGEDVDAIYAKAKTSGLKMKDLVMMPARVAIALQTDGWWLRSHIIWHKSNPMPESIRDRPTSAHESVFLLTKSARYFYDAEAVKVPAIYPGDNRAARPDNTQAAREKKQDALGKRTYEGFNDRYFGTRAKTGNPTGETVNLRNVWSIPSQPFSGAHFATFPPALIEPCIKAGSRPGDMILDPFGGAGTTGLVADRLGRDATLIELNPAYIDIAERRIRGDQPLFAEVETA